jgi:hypothetical protein
MNRFRVFVWVALSIFGCAPNCDDDGTCQRQCPENTWAACTDMNLCRCESFQDVLETGALKLMEVCRDPQPAELMVSEVLVDGEPTEDQEFIEIRNMSEDLIRLDGVSLHVKRGQKMRKSIGISTGCVPPGGLVLFSAQEAEPATFPEWEIKPTYDYRRFVYSNSADFIAQLLLFDQVVLDSVELEQSRIIPGVSLVRDFNTDSDAFVDHRSAGRGRSSSPGLCSDGSEVDSGCKPTLVDCSPPMPRELVINEVLIDAAPESGEFVELVNQTQRSLDLSGISLHAISRDLDTPKIKIWGGCLPAGQTVTFFAKASDVLARDDTLATLQFEVQRFHFPNERTTRFELRNDENGLLDAFLCPASQIEESVSLNRYPDVSGWLIFKHTRYFDSPASPGLRARTTAYEASDN